VLQLGATPSKRRTQGLETTAGAGITPCSPFRTGPGEHVHVIRAPVKGSPEFRNFSWGSFREKRTGSSCCCSALPPAPGLRPPTRCGSTFLSNRGPDLIFRAADALVGDDRFRPRRRWRPSLRVDAEWTRRDDCRLSRCAADAPLLRPHRGALALGNNLVTPGPAATPPMAARRAASSPLPTHPRRGGRCSAARRSRPWGRAIQGARDASCNPGRPSLPVVLRPGGASTRGRRRDSSGGLRGAGRCVLSALRPGQSSACRADRADPRPIRGRRFRFVRPGWRPVRWNRGQYQIAVPVRPRQAPGDFRAIRKRGWNRNSCFLIGGAGCGPFPTRRERPPACCTARVLARGFRDGMSHLTWRPPETIATWSCRPKSLMMAKEHFIESVRAGALQRFPSADRAQSIVQHWIANAYPGIYGRADRRGQFFPDALDAPGQQPEDCHLPRRPTGRIRRDGRRGVVWKPARSEADVGKMATAALQFVLHGSRAFKAVVHAGADGDRPR